MMREQIVTIFCAVAFMSTPLLSSGATAANLLRLPRDETGFCSRVGEVFEKDMWAQAFLIKPGADAQLETIPFSRWTEFFAMSAGPKIPTLRAIDPTDVQIGDRLCVLFDPNEASALRILVMTPTNTGRPSNWRLRDRPSTD